MHGGMAPLAMDLATLKLVRVRVFGNLANNLDMVRPEGSICTYQFVRDKIWLF
jgi:hypothetical protein